MFPQYSVPSIWDEMERIQREMNRLFDGAHPSRLSPEYPALNVWIGEDSQVISAELPGIQIDDLDINVLGRTLTISGERKPESALEGAEMHRQERPFGKFSRSIELPYPVEAGKVRARLEKGVLTITLPRAEADKPRKIAVKSS
ncbi:MAG: Hsp20/alpha crystallin family protein [Anaerolineaceae bacterium]|nr:Hsp20/alpha crystallin family protein [Anaerolineaceae bacterium]